MILIVFFIIWVAFSCATIFGTGIIRPVVMLIFSSTVGTDNGYPVAHSFNSKLCLSILLIHIIFDPITCDGSFCTRIALCNPESRASIDYGKRVMYGSRNRLEIPCTLIDECFIQALCFTKLQGEGCCLKIVAIRNT